MQRYSIPDLAQAHGLDVYARLLLHELVQVADWQDEHRGTVRGFTVTGWAEYLGGISRRRLTEALAALEAAGLIVTDLRRGHDGTVRVLVYDDVTHAPAGRERREAPESRTRPVGASDPKPYAPSGRERPAETPPKNARVEEPPSPRPEKHSEPTRADAAGDPKHDLGKVRATVDALRDRLDRSGQRLPARLPRTEPLIADRLAEGWTPYDLAAALCAPPWPVDPITHPDGFFARRATADRLGSPPRPRPAGLLKLRDEDCPTCDGTGVTAAGNACACFHRARGVTA